MIWRVANRNDARCRALADRHYSRQNPGSPGFVPPGRCLVLYADEMLGEACWVTSWPLPQYVKHRWAGAWVNSLFRNEGAGLSSSLVASAVAATRAYFGAPPTLGIITMVDTDKVSSRNPGYCYKVAGWKLVGKTVTREYLVFQQVPSDMPGVEMPVGYGGPHRDAEGVDDYRIFC